MNTIPNLICQIEAGECNSSPRGTNDTNPCLACGTLTVEPPPSSATATGLLTGKPAAKSSPTAAFTSPGSSSHTDSVKIGVAVGVALGVFLVAITAFVGYQRLMRKRRMQREESARAAEGHPDPSEEDQKEGQTSGGTDPESKVVIQDRDPLGTPEMEGGGELVQNVQEVDGQALPSYSRELQGSPAAKRVELA